MRRFIPTAILALIIAGAASGGATEEQKAGPPEGPRLQLLSKELNLGEIKRGERASDTVWYRNSGEAPLAITSIASDCGCTAANYSHEPLLPGEKAYLVVTFDSRNRGLGNFHKTLRIRSNALNFRELLVVTGTIIRE